MDATPPEALADRAEPTRVRFLIIAVASLSAMLMYLDRACLAIMGAYIPADLGLSERDWAWALVPSSTLTLWARSPPVGWPTGSAPVGCWPSISSPGPPARPRRDWRAGSPCWYSRRLACGLAQAGGYPTSAVLLRRWIPTSKRARSNAMVALGGRLGLVVAPWITALLIVALVPAQVPCRIEPPDVLDPARLGRDLISAEAGPPAALRREVRAHFPADALAAARRLAGGSPRPEDPETLRAGLNQVIAAPSLADGLADARPVLSREALAFLDTPTSRRSLARTERFNRLALEAASPTALRSLYARGWRPVLFLYGALGGLVALLSWSVVRDRPGPRSGVAAISVPSGVDDTESRFRAGRDATVERRGVVRRLASSPNMWLSGLTQGCINLGWVFLITLLPTYLGETFDVPLDERGKMMAVSTFVGCFGMFAGGFLSDRLVGSIGLRWGRALPIAMTQFASAAALLSCPWLPSAWAVVAALAVMAAMVDLGVPSVWAFCQDVGGRDVGAALGWGNMWGNFGAALSPVLLTWIKERCGWDAAFATCAAAFAVAGLSGLCMNATKPLRR